MKVKFIIPAAFAIVWVGAASGQNSIESVLRQVEANNKTLRARSALAEAETLAERTGNSLPDPEAAYEHVWGNPSSLGKQSELTVTQSFDFPSAYAARNRLAELRGKQHASEYDLFRQETLLEARELCIEIISLRRRMSLFDMRSCFACEIAEAAGRKLEAGGINAMEAAEARIQQLAAGNAVRLIEVGIADAMGRLRILNGGVEVDFPDADFPDMAGLPPFGEMLEVYLDSDPALCAATAGRDAARQDVRASRSASLPGLTVGYKLERGGGERFNGIVAGMSIPMFGNRNNVKRARAQELYASLRADDARMSVEQRLTTLYEKAALLEESIRNYEEITGDTEEYLDNLAKALRAGQIGVTDYFSQYDAIIVFEEALIDLKTEYHLVRARIFSVVL